jgi:transposase
VTLSTREQQRVFVLNKMEKGELTGKQAAQVMGLSLRQTRRLLAGYREQGVAALAHGNRGRQPPNALSQKVRQRVVHLAATEYSGFNQQHLSELLGERQGICLSRSSVRNILSEAGIKSPRRRRPPKHRSRRERYPQEGMLLQIDASPHDWLEGRGPTLSLIGAIDDATGTVPCAIFREHEDAIGYFKLLKEIASGDGLPLAIYRDRHSIFEVAPTQLPSLADQLAGKPPLTQFGRLMAELDIRSIAALSPQAKGRIERLWGTFQDRLVHEMRLAQVNALAAANQFLVGFLPRYNLRFSVTAAQPGRAYRQTDGIDLEQVFCFKHKRVVGLDNVVRFERARLQILPSSERQSYARAAVEVHEQLDGGLKVCYQGRYLHTCTAPPEATTMRRLTAVTPIATSKCAATPVPPPANHPWRRWVSH